MAEEGGEVREVRQKYLRYKDKLFYDSVLVEIVSDTIFLSKDFLWVSVHLSGLYTSGKSIKTRYVTKKQQHC